ncbi:MULTISPECIES: hypothetical protein [Hydrogenophaga]|jgi:hypothetical protein|uniref:hypothetical protein n=1 Tax=Hydrogenophaga TaxID=47420 RepID=UPI0003F4549C|nr:MULTISPECIES: hypothetical protein [Hydrogenophaga]EWS64812.1 hypothetical protein Y695_01941 [Hydrogenophaga sp. T4]MBU4183606.1 hypothetical protein [Gammaproteobacteria bacterium]MBW8469463.1 hypothetical protein [Thiobacillus sp.]MBE0587621.1 hypothetical protein [Hydrogenophaga sp.]MBQ0918174.1 hypothetical protein [Hydrogenophaga aromaticivorans]
MLLFRWTIFMLLLAAGVSFAFYIGTGQARFRQYGIVILKWTVIAALGFFGVLVLERLL